MSDVDGCNIIFYSLSRFEFYLLMKGLSNEY